MAEDRPACRLARARVTQNWESRAATCSSRSADRTTIERHLGAGPVRTVHVVATEELSGDKCFICEKHDRGADVPGGVIYDDGVIYAGHTHPLDAEDAALGYLMVEPRRHVSLLGDLTDEEAAAMGVVVNRLSRALRDVIGAEHVYSFVFGDRVPHLHVHLAPRYPGTPPGLFGLGAVHIQRSKAVRRGAVKDIDQVCSRLRATLA